jgi:triosephosphate isomerase (TIM)
MTPRQRLIVGNWKMHKTIPEARDFVKQLAGFLSKTPPANVTIVLAPPFTALQAVASALTAHGLTQNLPVLMAGQDMHWEDFGAFTGEVSPLMLKDLGCPYVIVGHSERRRDFGEIDAMVNKKVAAALRHGLRPILCIGETWDQRTSSQTELVLSSPMNRSGRSGPAIRRRRSKRMTRIGTSERR